MRTEADFRIVITDSKFSFCLLNRDSTVLLTQSCGGRSISVLDSVGRVQGRHCIVSCWLLEAKGRLISDIYFSTVGFNIRLIGIKRQTSYHTVEVGDHSILVGVGVKQHLGVGVNGYVGFHTLFVLAQELGDGLDFWLRFGEGTAVGVVAGVRGGAFIWGGEGEQRLQSYRLIASRWPGAENMKEVSHSDVDSLYSGRNPAAVTRQARMKTWEKDIVGNINADGEWDSDCIWGPCCLGLWKAHCPPVFPQTFAFHCA